MQRSCRNFQEQEQQRVVVGPGNKQCTFIREVSLRTQQQQQRQQQEQRL